MKKRLTTGKEAREKVEALQEETGIRYTKGQKQIARERLIGKRPWFE